MGFTTGTPLQLTRQHHTVWITVVIRDALSVREATARFNISNESVVLHWINVYKEAGLTGLLNIKRGRGRQMTKENGTHPQTDKELEKLSPEELRAELRYLRAENAYLKKLKALVQSGEDGRKPE
ncbi:insertion element IS1661 DNA-binding protein [Yersinia aleksiciae]|nr:insertion element IS1661 DNA-binding protein [Yersinia aleksiciae]